MVRSPGGGTTSVSSQVCGRDGARPSNRVWLVTSAIFCAGIMLTLAENNLSRDSDYDYDPPEAGRYSLPVIKPAADRALLDSHNKSVKLTHLTRGPIPVLRFIYTPFAAPQAPPPPPHVLHQIHYL